mmetsp:Transcript_57892/g.152437  ORF Transcript_57892/g.152437 Transcript_57892/m.152437 type:complete len:219 (-) Transcript_57892:179-835(-)
MALGPPEDEADVGDLVLVGSPQNAVRLLIARLLVEDLHRAVAAAGNHLLRVRGFVGAAGGIETPVLSRGAAHADAPPVDTLQNMHRGQDLVHAHRRGVDVPEAHRPIQRARHPLLLAEGVPHASAKHLRVPLCLRHVADVHVALDGGLDHLRRAFSVVDPGMGVRADGQEDAARDAERQGVDHVPFDRLQAPERVLVVGHAVEVKELDAPVHAAGHHP